MDPKTTTTPSGAGQLLRVLGAGFGIAVVIGNTIGAGILRTPGQIAAQLKSPWLIMSVWVLGGGYALLATISVSELATSLPLAGGFYVYSRRAFGDLPGFVVGWSDWLGNCAALAFVAVAMGGYCGVISQRLSDHPNLVGVAVLSGFALLQWMGVRLSGLAQQLTSFIKAIGFLALIAACFIGGGGQILPSRSAAAVTQSPMAMGAIFVALMIALQSVISTYDGWYGAIYFAEEDTNPAKNLPRSMIGGILAVIVIYLLVNLALLHIVPVDQMAQSDLPAALAAEALFGARGAVLITWLVLLSLPSTINAILMMATRIIFALSRNDLFMPSLGSVNRRGTPAPALALSTVASIGLIATGSFEKLIAIAAFFYVVNYAATFTALFVLRKKEPGLPRPFQARPYPWTPLLVVAGSFALLIGFVTSDPQNSLLAIALIAVSLPVYWLSKKWRAGRATNT